MRSVAGATTQRNAGVLGRRKTALPDQHGYTRPGRPVKLTTRDAELPAQTPEAHVMVIPATHWTTDMMRALWSGLGKHHGDPPPGETMFLIRSLGILGIAGLLGCAGAAPPRTDAAEHQRAAGTSIVPTLHERIHDTARAKPAV